MLNKTKNILSRSKLKSKLSFEYSKLSFRCFKKLDYRYYIGIILIAILIVGGAIYILRAPQTTEAAWWNITWSYRKSIAVTNSSGSELTDFQIQILDDEDLSALVTAGKLESDLADLRFTDTNNRVLDYWIEDDTNASVNVWIKVPSIPTTGTTVYMYYGNSSASDDSDATKIIGNSGNPGTSCTDIKNNRDASTGVYYIKPTGASDEFQAYCDMDTDDGGWTLVLQNNYGLASPQPSWEEAVNSNNITGSFGTTLTAFDVFIGVSYWDTLGNTARLEQGATPSSLSHQAYYTLTLDDTDYYSLEMSNGNITIHTEGTEVPGMYSYHNGRPLTTYDADHDDNAGNCSVNYGNTAWWYGSCWSGNFWGHSSGYDYWTGSSAENFVWGGIWLRGTVSAITISVGALTSEENAPGPIGYWNFDEGYGTTAYDSTGYGNDGTITGATWVQNGKKGKALSFNGSSDYVDCGNDESLEFGTGDFSISAWVKTSGNSEDWAGILWKGKVNDPAPNYEPSYSFSKSGSSDSYFFNAGHWADRASFGALEDGEWHYLVGVVDSGVSKAYLDGKYQNQSIATDSDYSTSFKIGIGVLSRNFNGLIDEVRIYDKALSENEVKQLYNQNAGSFNMGQTRIPRSCADQLAMAPGSSSGVYTIDPGYGVDPFEVYCDMETDGGGWTLVMNRTKGVVTTNSTDLISLTDNDKALTNLRWQALRDNSIYTLSKDSSTWVKFDISKMQSASCKTLADSLTDNELAHDETLECTSTGGDYSQFFGVYDQLSRNTYHSWSSSNSFLVSQSGTLSRWEPDSASMFVGGENLITQPNVVLDLPFESQSGSTTYDESGNENDGTISGATWKTATNCKEGRCFEFDGTSDTLTVTNDDSLNFGTGSFSISTWINPNNSGNNYPSIVHKYDGDGYMLALAQTTEKIRFYVYGAIASPSWTTTSDMVDFGEWSYITVTFESYTDNGSQSVVKFYKDGVLIETQTGGDAGNIDTAANLMVSGLYGGFDEFAGKMDSLKIYDTVLTQREIMEEMSAGKPSPVLDMDFNEGGGSTAYDKSGQDNDGTIKSNASWKTAEDCVSGSCVYIDGTDSTWNSVQVAEDDSLDGMPALSVNLWLKISGAKSHQVIYKRHVGDPQWSSYRMNISGSNILSFNVTNESQSVSTATANGALSLDTWYHVVGVYDGAGVQIYVNGLAKDATPGVLTGNVLDSPSYLQIGGLDGSWMMNGYIDELKIYPYALTTQEIKQEYIQSKGQFGQTNVVGSNAVPVTGGPILDMNFDQYSGGVYLDKSGNGYNGTPAGDPTWKTAVNCKSGRCLDFDGEDDEVSCGDNIDLGNESRTFSMWVYTKDSLGDDYERLLQPTQDDTYFFLDNRSGVDNFSFGFRNSQDTTWRQKTIALSTALPPNEWSYIVGTIDIANPDSKGIKIYRNGILVGSDSTYGDAPISRSLDMLINQRSTFKSIIDEVKIYDRVLTQAEIMELYNGGQPIGWWRFDEGADNLCFDGTDVCDNSGEGNNGTISGDPTWITDTASCKQGGCIDFDGTGDKVDVGVNDLVQDISVSAWIKNSSSGSEKIIVGKGWYNDASGKSWWLLRDSDNKLKFGVITDGNEAIYDSVIDTSGTDWYHVIGTYDGVTIKIFVNGIEGISYSKSGSLPTGANVKIGMGYYNGDSYGFIGTIDDVRIYNYALTEDQISEVYNQGLIHFK